jgi:hypothetical protein
VELEYYDGNDWLLLLDVWPELDAEAPWKMIRDEASAESWFDFLASHPEYADKADWKRIFEAGKTKKYFDMLAKQPALYEFCPDKEKLQVKRETSFATIRLRPPCVLIVTGIEIRMFPLGNISGVIFCKFLHNAFHSSAFNIHLHVIFKKRDLIQNQLRKSGELCGSCLRPEILLENI